MRDAQQKIAPQHLIQIKRTLMPGGEREWMDRLNAAPVSEFCALLDGVWEHSPWIVAQTAHMRPFENVEGLMAAMWTIVCDADDSLKLALLRAHPDLAGRLARAGNLSCDSGREQASLGLDRLGDAEYERFSRWNREYRERFDFPFIICVRNHTKASIAEAFERRLGNNISSEMQIALDEVRSIAAYRVRDRSRGMNGKLTTHVLDLVRGCPAAGMRIDLMDESGSVLKTLTTNQEGRTESPALSPAEMRTGVYEFRFFVGTYFGETAFLDVVPVRFRISGITESYHVPLLCTPWSYSTYRGS
jgi:2-oxo-4-hydroxy-4-carboxy-5-ureidoimidazoline decarboxylase